VTADASFIFMNRNQSCYFFCRNNQN